MRRCTHCGGEHLAEHWERCLDCGAALPEQVCIRKALACKDHKYERIAGDLRCVHCGISFTFPLSNVKHERLAKGDGK